MIDWIKNINKPFPEYWKNYLNKFDKKSNRYVVLSIDTTGLNPVKDKILTIGAIVIIEDQIILGESFEAYISENETESLELAIESFINFIGNDILVGYHIDFDVEILNENLHKLHCGRLKNEALDIEIMYKKWQEDNDTKFSLDELITIFKVPKSENSSASDDVFSIALLFLRLKKRLRLR